MSEVVRTHIYCASKASPKSRGKRSTYLVETLTGEDNVVARISPMPMVSETIPTHEVTINALRAGLTATGEWKEMKTHSRVEVTPRKVTTSATPRRTKPQSLDREGGVSDNGHKSVLPRGRKDV